MPIVELENFGSGGIVRDREAYTLPPEYWSNGKNVRFLNGEVVKVLGEEEYGASWAAYSVPLWVQPWRDASSTGYWLGATATKILRFTSAIVTDVTRSSGDYVGTNTTTWTGAIIGGIPVLNNDANDHPQSWEPGTGLFVDLPNWDPGATGDRCRVMRAFKQYLIAFDISRSGNRYPHKVKWSSPAVPGSVPDFWDNANSNDSNEFDLSEGGGFVVDSEPLGDINIIYKEEKSYGMQHIGGEFVFRFYELPFKSGIFAPRCAKVVDGKAFVMTKDDVILHNGQEAVSVIDSFNRNYLFDNISVGKERRTFVVPNYAFNEVWICFVSSGVDGDFADEALIWNYKDNTWGHKTLNGVPHIAYGLLDKSGVSTIIDDQFELIDSDTNIIDGNADSAGKLRLLGSQAVTTNSKLIEFDSTNQNLGTDMISFVEREGITIVGKDRQGEPKVSNYSTKLVQRIYPKIKSTGAVNIYIGYQTRLNGSINYTPALSFDPETDNHLDVRLQGKAICLKIESTGNIEWSATGMSFEMEVVGDSNR